MRDSINYEYTGMEHDFFNEDLGFPDFLVSGSLAGYDSEFKEEGAEAGGNSCVTPGNPYILHCFPAHKTDLTKDHHKHLDQIVKKIKLSFRGSRPITRVNIVGHAATWKGISKAEYSRRARVRAKNAQAQIRGRLANARLGGKVTVTVGHHANNEPLVDNMIHSSSSTARNNRALNRRVEISLGAPKKKKKKKTCKKIAPNSKPFPKCRTIHGPRPKAKIDAAKAVAANRILSKKTFPNWALYIEDITQKVLFTYRYKLDDPGFAQAVANWQRENCFRWVNGIIGEKEWTEMKHILMIATILSKIDIRKKKMLRFVNTLMPRGYFGACATKATSNRYGLPETIDALQTIAINWQLKHPTTPLIQIRDISPPYGRTKKWLTHNSHRMGIDVDIRPMRNDCRALGVDISNKAYSQKLTQKLVNTIINNGVLKVYKIFFDDLGITPRGVVTCDGKHKNHMHVRFCMPANYDLKRMKKEAFPEGTRGIYEVCSYT